MKDFKEFPKMARFARDIIITEKIDGTNASIDIEDIALTDLDDPSIVAIIDKWVMRVGSRTRWITPKDDNFGFANWAFANQENLIGLGEGTHFGEWWGPGIQRGYGLKEKRFSLFNVKRWNSPERPTCCHVVPTLYEGPFITTSVEHHLALLNLFGSVASPDFMRPEGIVIFHTAGNVGFKRTIEKDDIPKSLINQ